MKKKGNKKMPAQRQKVIQSHPYFFASVYELFYLLSTGPQFIHTCTSGEVLKMDFLFQSSKFKVSFTRAR